MGGFFKSLYNYFHPNMVNMLGGDFNMIDDPILDACLPNPKITKIAKLTDLCRTCDIQDNF